MNGQWQRVIRPITEYVAPIGQYARLIEDYVRDNGLKIEVHNSTMVYQSRPDEGFDVVQVIVLTAKAVEGVVPFAILNLCHEDNITIGMSVTAIEDCAKKLVQGQTGFNPEHSFGRPSIANNFKHRADWGRKDIEKEFKFVPFVEKFIATIAG